MPGRRSGALRVTATLLLLGIVALVVVSYVSVTANSTAGYVCGTVVLALVALYLGTRAASLRVRKAVEFALLSLFVVAFFVATPLLTIFVPWWPILLLAGFGVALLAIVIVGSTDSHMGSHDPGDDDSEA